MWERKKKFEVKKMLKGPDFVFDIKFSVIAFLLKSLSISPTLFLSLLLYLLLYFSPSRFIRFCLSVSLSLCLSLFLPFTLIGTYCNSVSFINCNSLSLTISFLFLSVKLSVVCFCLSHNLCQLFKNRKHL